MVRKIVILNGPPGSGKDTGAELLESMTNLNIKVLKFARPLKQACCAIYCDNNKTMFDLFDSPNMKDIPNPTFFGGSCRDAQIDLSENYLKPKYGKQIFGTILANEIMTIPPNNIVVISDGGFIEELQPLIDAFGRETISIVKLHRHGCDFSRDSRGYFPDTHGCAVYNVHNTTTKQNLLEKLLSTIVLEK